MSLPPQVDLYLEELTPLGSPTRGRDPKEKEISLIIEFLRTLAKSTFTSGNLSNLFLYKRSFGIPKLLWTVLICLILGAPAKGESIDSVYYPRKFNIGFSSGIGGLHFFMMPVLEFKVYNFTLRGNYGFRYTNLGIDYETKQVPMYKLRKLLGTTKGHLLISIQNNDQRSAWCPDKCSSLDYNNIYALLFGVKSYPMKRYSVSYKLGIAANQYKQYDFYRLKPEPEKEGVNFFPFGEMAFRIYIFKNQTSD